MGFSILFSFTSFRFEFLSQLLLIGTKEVKGHLCVFGGVLFFFVFFFFILGRLGEAIREKEEVVEWGREEGKSLQDEMLK